MVFYVHDLLHLRGSLPNGTECSVNPSTPFNKRLEALETRLMPEDEQKRHRLEAGQLVLQVKKHVKLYHAAYPQFYDGSFKILSCARNGLVLVPRSSGFERGTNQGVLVWRGPDDDLKAWVYARRETLPPHNAVQTPKPQSRQMCVRSGVA